MEEQQPAKRTKGGSKECQARAKGSSRVAAYEIPVAVPLRVGLQAGHQKLGQYVAEVYAARPRSRLPASQLCRSVGMKTAAL